MDDSYWYVPNEHGPVGPVSGEFLRKFLSERADWWDVPVWKDGFEDWTKAGEIAEFRPPLPQIITHKGPPPYNARRARPSESGDTSRSKEPDDERSGAKAAAIQSNRAVQGIRWLSRIGFGLLSLALVLVGAGAQRAPHLADNIVGIIIYGIGICIIYLVFFHWDRTAIRRENRPGVVRRLGIGYLTLGIILLLGVIALAALVNPNVGMKLMRDVMGEVIGSVILFVVVLEGLALTVVGLGMLKETRWSRTAAVLLAFLLSFGWPLGFIIALLTWWGLATAPRRASVGAQSSC